MSRSNIVPCRIPNPAGRQPRQQRCSWCGRPALLGGPCLVTADVRDALTQFKRMYGYRWRNELRERWWKGQTLPAPLKGFADMVKGRVPSRLASTLLDRWYATSVAGRKH